MEKEKISRSDALRIAQEISDMPFKELEKRGHRINVGEGNIKTEEDIVKLRQNIEGSIWNAIKAQYILYDC
jgi:hypothetical protein